MERIKFIADTASDIPDAELLEYNIDMPSVPIAIDGQEFFERKSFSIKEFYKVLAGCAEIPKTSRVPVADYVACYKAAYEQGYSDVISVTINAGGSGTYTSSKMAVDVFFREMPQAKGRINIHVVDSQTYSIAYGYPVITAAQMARDGKTVPQILDYLDDYFSHMEIYLACYSLKYAKYSGRIGAAAAFVGEVLGLRPIIAMVGGTTKTVAKVRGESKVIGELLRIAMENCTDTSAQFLVIGGSDEAHVAELQALAQKKLKRSVPLYYAGASIVINAGPEIAALVIRGKKHS